MRVQFSVLNWSSLALVLLFGRITSAEPEKKQVVPKVTTTPVNGFSPRGYYTSGTKSDSYFYWVDEAWTASDKPFIALEKQVQALLSPKADKKVVWQRLRNRSLALPLDARVQYRWAYAAFLIFSRRWQSGQDERWAFQGIREAMEKPNSPHSYRYTRIRMFMNEWDPVWTIRAMPYIRRCAMRLLKRNPNDEDIKHAFAFDFSLTSNTIKEQDLAYKWANEYVKRYPNKAQSYYLIGTVLGNRFTRFQTRTMAQNALYYLRKCQHTLPKNHYYQKRASQQIANVNEAIEIFE